MHSSHPTLKYDRSSWAQHQSLVQGRVSVIIAPPHPTPLEDRVNVIIITPTPPHPACEQWGKLWALRLRLPIFERWLSSTKQLLATVHSVQRPMLGMLKVKGASAIQNLLLVPMRFDSYLVVPRNRKLGSSPWTLSLRVLILPIREVFHIYVYNIMTKSLTAVIHQVSWLN